MRKKLLENQSNSIRNLIVTYSHIIRIRSNVIKDWLVTSIAELSVMVIRIE